MAMAAVLIQVTVSTVQTALAGYNYVDADGDGVCDNYNLRATYQDNTYRGLCHTGGYCR